MSSARRTVKAVAAITGSMGCEGGFTYALGANGVWHLRLKTCAVNEHPEATGWAVCDSPLGVLGLTADQLTGAFSHGGQFRDLPGLAGWGLLSDVWAFGDIGHRFRLPAHDRAVQMGMA